MSESPALPGHRSGRRAEPLESRGQRRPSTGHGSPRDHHGSTGLDQGDSASLHSDPPPLAFSTLHDGGTRSPHVDPALKYTSGSHVRHRRLLICRPSHGANVTHASILGSNVDAPSLAADASTHSNDDARPPFLPANPSASFTRTADAIMAPTHVDMQVEANTSIFGLNDEACSPSLPADPPTAFTPANACDGHVIFGSNDAHCPDSLRLPPPLTLRAMHKGDAQGHPTILRHRKLNPKIKAPLRASCTAGKGKFGESTKIDELRRTHTGVVGGLREPRRRSKSISQSAPGLLLVVSTTIAPRAPHSAAARVTSAGSTSISKSELAYRTFVMHTAAAPYLPPHAPAARNLALAPLAAHLPPGYRKALARRTHPSSAAAAWCPAAPNPVTHRKRPRAVHGHGTDAEDGSFDGTPGSATHFSTHVHHRRAMARRAAHARGAARSGTKGCNSSAASSTSMSADVLLLPAADTGKGIRADGDGRRAPTGSVAVFAPGSGSLIRMASAGSTSSDVARPSYCSPARCTVAAVSSIGGTAVC
ncbi:hypothetical protein GGX14DRAFT_625284 [Mycena pura]|uniref:Uncharacterized protein n=1 Tax=Mycena pura TaxID=153505 RepID=A0AAD6VI41_9AGAR|nr:hypothetical protein GGX14DRAFT_625284 [Mycena pura]